jgi:hypothetical protein
MGFRSMSISTKPSNEVTWLSISRFVRNLHGDWTKDVVALLA